MDGEEMVLFKDQFDDWEDTTWDVPGTAPNTITAPASNNNNDSSNYNDNNNSHGDHCLAFMCACVTLLQMRSKRKLTFKRKRKFRKSSTARLPRLQTARHAAHQTHKPSPTHTHDNLMYYTNLLLLLLPCLSQWLGCRSVAVIHVLHS